MNLEFRQSIEKSRQKYEQAWHNAMLHGHCQNWSLGDWRDVWTQLILSYPDNSVTMGHWLWLFAGTEGLTKEIFLEFIAFAASENCPEAIKKLRRWNPQCL